MKNQILLLIVFAFIGIHTNAQKTIQFRINGVANNLGDMDGFGLGASDPQWNYEIDDNTFGISDNDSYELSGTNCAGIRSHLNTFFSQEYDCELPTSFDFIFRGFEDDAIGSDANSGDRTFTFVTAGMNTTGNGVWYNVFGGSGWVEVRASGTTCGATLNTPYAVQGSGGVRYQIRLQYRVTGTSLCNDECASPYVLPTAAQYDCGPTQTSTPLNVDINATEPADASQFSHTMAGVTCTYDGASPEDIWVRTTVPDSSGGVVIQFENEGGCSGVLCQTNITYAWYTSSNGTCSGLQYRGCDAVSCFIGCSDGEIHIDGVAGEDVWVRIWEEDDQGFDITINEITPTAPGDMCYTAQPLSGVGCNYQATSLTSGPYAEPDIASWTAGAHPGGVCQDGDSNPATNTIWASNENMVWYTYTHSGGDFNLAIDNMNCTGGAATAQIGVFSNSGTPASPSCDLASETGYGCSVGQGAIQLSIASLPVGNYIIVVDGNAGAECDWTFTDFIGNDPLPVEMFNFKAVLNHPEEVELTWTTGSERDNDYFLIQRSVTGYDWEDVTTVMGAGNSTHAINYRAYDYEPYTGVSYYRIAQVDFDGTTTYSDPQSINNNILTDIKVYPNPANSQLTIEFDGEDETNFQIVNQVGQLIPTDVFIVKDKAKIYVGDLPEGIYFIRVSRNGFLQTEKFMVKH
jgi:hypothetical protein